MGSNIGETRSHLLAAVAALPEQGVTVLRSSSTYETEPVGLVLDQPEFLNACLEVETSLDPEGLLDACKAVEREVGRVDAADPDRQAVELVARVALHRAGRRIDDHDAGHGHGDELPGDDLRESPTLKIMQILQQRGAEFDYNDPYFPQLHKMRHYNYENMKSVPISAQTLATYDGVVIATDHTSYDYGAIVDGSKLVVDTRNATRRVMRNRDRIVLC